MRRFLAATLLTVLGVTGVGAQVHTGDPAKRGLTTKDFPRTKELAPGVYSYEALRAGDPGGYMTTNSLIVISNDGVLVADGQGNVQQAQEMVDWIKGKTNQPIKYMVVCSDHGDHTGGNSVFPSTTTFIASPTSLLVLAKAGKPPIPTDSVAHRRVIHMGDKTIEILNLGRAHTGGDLEVWMPKEKVLFMSEAYLHDVFPAMRSAYPSEWLQTVKNARTIDATWYIPGHGFVDSPARLKADLLRFQNAIAQVNAEATRLHDAGIPCPAPARGGRGGGGAATGARAGGAPRPLCEAAEKGNWGDLKNWTLFGSQVETAIRKVYEEVDGKLSY